MLAIALALGSSVAYGVSNFLGPLQSRAHSVAAVLLVGQLAALLGASLTLLVASAPAPGATGIELAALAGLGNVVGLAAFYRAAELGPISVAAPFAALGAVVPVIYGLATGESVGPVTAAGIVLAIGGATLAARRQTDSEVSPTRASVAFAVLSTCAFGVFATALPTAAEHGSWWAIFVARVAVVAGVAIGFALARPTLRLRPGDLPMLALPGLLLLLGTVLYVLAADRGLLSVVAPLGTLFPVVTVGLALLVLGERVTREQGAGIAGALGGMVLISV